jgi:hypothetical protein
VTLEAALRALASHDIPRHLTMSFCSDGQFMASFRAKDSDGYNVQFDRDPAMAIMRALAKPVSVPEPLLREIQASIPKPKKKPSDLDDLL